MIGGKLLKATNLAFRTGFHTGVQAFRRYYDNPSMVEGGAARESRADQYLALWAYYDNSAFEDIFKWAQYRSQYRLYARMRSLYNPTRRLVDFYAGQVYPGVLSEDGTKLPDGVPLAIPLSVDTPAELKSAIAQLWRWSNWQANKAVYVRYGAACGNVMVEILDNVDAGKVAANVVWPGLITWLDLDSAGNVKAYVMEYFATGDDGLRYVYRKEVDSDEYATFKDGEPFDYTGGGTRWANPYGFVPAVWVKHKEIGGDFGAPAIHGSIGKLDEVNSLASHIHDQIHTVIGAPIGVFSDGMIGKGMLKPVTATNEIELANANPWQGSRRPPPNEFGRAAAPDRGNVLILNGPFNTKVESIAGKLPLSEAMDIVQKLIEEVEQDHPELALFRELRSMSQLTGPAANRIMGDVAGLVSESSASYDRGSIAIFQMACAIGGWRANNGDWGPLSRQQLLFAPFDLDSYDKGHLDFDIDPRPLVTPTETERLAIEREKLAITIDQRVAAADPTQLATTMAGAAATNVVRTVIPRGGA